MKKKAEIKGWYVLGIILVILIILFLVSIKYNPYYPPFNNETDICTLGTDEDCKIFREKTEFELEPSNFTCLEWNQTDIEQCLDWKEKKEEWVIICFDGNVSQCLEFKVRI